MSRIFQDIPSKWNLRKLDSITEDIKSGFASGKRDENGIVQLRMNNVDVGGNINLEKTLKVPLPKNIEDYLLQNGDVLFNNTNSVDLIGKTSIFNDEIIPCTYSNHLTRIRGDSTKVDQKWILYILISLWKKGIFYRICNRHVGQAGITSKDINNLRIPVPPLVEQRGIVEVLGTVDECIRLTDAVIERAEELKRGLMQQLLTRGIGHKEYKETPLGEMPKTWKIMSLGDPSISKIIMGQSPPSSSYNSKGNGLPFLQGNAEFGYKFPKIILYTTKPQKTAQENDILISVRAPVGELNYAPYRLCIGRGLSAIRVNAKNLSNDFIYYYLKQNINRLHALSTGSTFKAIRKEELYSFKLPIPNIVEQNQIIKILNNVNDKILHEKEKQQYFIKLKQGLIQLLLSGKIRVELKGDGLHRIGDGREANN